METAELPRRLVTYRRAGIAVLTVLLAGCNITSETQIVDGCVIGPNNSCVAANLNGLDLHGQNLSGTDLTLARLRSANLQDANMTGSILFEADLTGANTSGADFGGANMIGLTCPNGKVAKPVKPGGRATCWPK